MLNDTQLMILKTIEELKEKNDKPPTIEEIKIASGITSIPYNLLALEKHLCISRTKGESRNIKILKSYSEFIK